jgi:hypothetical protein
MTWRKLFTWRPRWWIAGTARLSQAMGPGSDRNSDDTHRSSAKREHFWEEFRAGQREADRRALTDREALASCDENGPPK